MKVWVVTCEQLYANHSSVVGVAWTKTAAERLAATESGAPSDCKIEEFEVVSLPDAKGWI